VPRFRKENVHANSPPSPPWGRGWRATGAFISRGERGAPRSAGRGGEGVKTVQVEQPRSTIKPGRPGRTSRPTARAMGQLKKCAVFATRRRKTTITTIKNLGDSVRQPCKRCGPRGGQVVWVAARSLIRLPPAAAKNREGDTHSGLTPSPPRQAERGAPCPPRLMKAPVAVHPLPQGGEGWRFNPLKLPLPSPLWGRGVRG
jgi:hypothetical protein